MVSVPVCLTSVCQAHISSCGKHLVILTSSYRVILVQDFWRLFPVPSSPSQTLIRSPPALKDVSKQVDFYIELPFSPTEGRLAYDRGRVAVASAHAVYVFTLDSILDRLGEVPLPPKDGSLQILPNSADRNPPWPNFRLSEVWFSKISSTLLAPCLELAETKLYLMFPGGSRDERGENMWCYDFAPSPSFVRFS